MRLFLYGGLVAAFIFLSFGINSDSNSDVITTSLLTEEDVAETTSKGDEESTHEDLPSPCINVEDILSRRSDNNDGGFRIAKALFSERTYAVAYFYAPTRILTQVYHENHSASHDRVYQYANAPPKA